jgi:general stress protein YciG
MLPTDTRNSRKVPFTSVGFLHQIPGTAPPPPLSQTAENAIIGALITELNEEFGLNLNSEPDLSRSFDPDTVHETGKTVFVGTSHMRRVARSGGLVLSCCSPGWTHSQENIKKSVERVSDLGMGGGGPSHNGLVAKQCLFGNR